MSTPPPEKILLTQASANSTFARVERLPALSPLKAALADGSRSCAVQVIGDSTGNDVNEWVYTLAQSIATEHPAWTVTHRLWSDTAQQYGLATVIQTGTAGDRYLDCSTGTKTRRLDPTASRHVPGTLDVRAKITMADWTPAALSSVMGRSAAEGNRGWYLSINSTGLLQWTWTSTGNAAQLVSKFSTATLGLADGSTRWIRAVFIPDNGAGGYDVKFYTAPDGATWTQLGATVTTAGVAALFDNSTVGYEIGGIAAAVGNAGMKVHEVQIRDGLDGPNIVPALPDLWPPYDTAACQVVGAPVLTFVNGSQPGANIAYHNATGRLAKITPDYGQLVTFISDSHNEGLYMGKAWTDYLDTFRLAVESEVPGSPVVLLTQNPEQSGSSWYREHAKRRLDLLGYARQKGVAVIDTYQAFIDAGWPGSLMADDIHPSMAGSLVWRNVVKAALDAA